MTSPFQCGSCVEPVLDKKNKVKPISYYVKREIVLKTIITGYEDKECTKPIGSMVPQVVEEKIDVRSLINKHKDEVGVANILARIIRTGDNSLLNQNVAHYVDVTNLPKSIADVQKKAIALESIYMNIPADLKKDMTLEQFVTTMTDEKIKAHYETIAKEKAKQKEVE